MSLLTPLFYLAALFAVLPHRTLAAIVLPYGPSEGDQQIDFSNDSSATTLSVPVVYFERLYTELYISPFGVVSFDDPISGPNADLDLETKSFVALFFTPASGGTVYYRTRQRGTPLSKEISAKVRRAFSDSPDFESDNTVLITWENLRSNEQDGSNIFQLALATDGRSSYAILVYHKIDWSRSGGRIAQAGFFCVDGRNEKLVNSGTDDMRQLPSISNFEDDGTFIYRISGPQPLDPRSNSFMGAGEEDYEEYTSDVYEDDEHLEPPSQGDFVHPLPAEDDRSDQSLQGQVVRPLPPASDTPSDPSRGDSPVVVPAVPLVPQPASSVIETLPTGSPVQLGCTPTDEGGQRSDCSSNAECVRYEAGYCCNCQAGYYGNGKECLKTDTPQRIIGNFEGAINGQAIPRTDLFVFIDTQEAQQHTALARIPSNLAPSLLLLHPVANVMDWLLAKPKSTQAYNGFQLTGGIFNRTVNIHVGDRSHIVIKQEFTGRDAQGSFNVNVFVTGTLPELSETSEVTYGDFIDTYRREGPGFIRSYTERDVAVKTAGDERQYRLTVDQQIHFTECPFRKFDLDPVQNVHVQRIAATYAPNEGVVRFASTAFAIPPGTNVDLAEASGPCAAGRHLCTETNMNCVPIDHTYRCECAPGFQHEVDETVPPRFRCVEKNDLPGAGPQVPPFSGASPGCTRHDQCHQWGECVFGVGGQPGHCKCRGWYVGDGVNHCGPPGELTTSDENFNGLISGEQAQPASSCGGYNCDRNAECVDQKCVCRSGFYGNGVQCEYETRPTVTAGAICRDHAECGENAQCVYSNQEGYYKCQCVPPYVGDGIECAREVQAEPATCETELGCHKFAQCVASGEQRMCQCLDGYMGDGYACVSSRPLPPGSSSDQQPAIGAGVQPIERRKCQDQTECHQLAHCVMDESSLDSSYYCRCLPGHRGDGASSSKATIAFHHMTVDCHRRQFRRVPATRTPPCAT
ncbi:Protein NID-1 b [Aphelenchoides avenae]|nr:Protein NID-1 b [Aphelenchus avenae]